MQALARWLSATLGTLLVAGVPAVAQGIWVNRLAPPGPAACNGMLIGFDRLRGETVWFGDQACAQTWVWNGATWAQRTSAATPPAREVVGVYDSARQCIVALFGGFSAPFETWEWNGASWTLRDSGSPPPRDGYGLAYDAARNVTVLFGGRNSGGSSYRADTWAWNGTSWTQIAFGGPTPRWLVGLAFDEQRQTLVLFGGHGLYQGQGTFFGDTWEWNGAYWLNHFGMTGPSPRKCVNRLVWDGVRQRAVLYGGTSAQASLTDMWEWNGAWSQVLPANNSGTNTFGMVHDESRGVIVKLANTVPPAIWEFVPGPAVAPSWNTYGAGCAGPNGVPLLTNLGGSLARIGSTLHLRMTNLPPSAVNVALGFLGFDAAAWSGIPLPLSLTPFGFPGCQALLAPVRSDNLANVAGVASWDVTMPMSVFALGAHVYFQGAVFVPGWNAGGFVFSNGAHAVVGSP